MSWTRSSTIRAMLATCACAPGCWTDPPVRDPAAVAPSHAGPAHAAEPATVAAAAGPAPAAHDPWAPSSAGAPSPTATPPSAAVPSATPPSPAGVAGAPVDEATAAAPPATVSATPGVTADEIKIGQSMAYSGPASAYGIIGKVEAAYFRMINDAGGVNGRKITLISLDDAYAPSKAVQNIRQLVEQEGVALIFGSLGTAANIAVQTYLNDRQVPQLFIATGADRWADPATFPWTMGLQPSYRIEARIYGKYILASEPRAKICVLYQNDDFGKDYLRGLKEGLTEKKFDKMLVKLASYEVTDPVVDSQVVALQDSGCDTLVSATTPKFGAQTIRKAYDLGWHPTLFMSTVATSINTVLQPAGLDKAAGIITGVYLKDPDDPSHRGDPGLAHWRTFMTNYLPGADSNDGNTRFAYVAAQTLVQVLTQCGKDLSRANIMKQAANLRHFRGAIVLPGIEVNTSPTDYRPISRMQLTRFDGTSFQRFGKVLDGD